VPFIFRVFGVFRGLTCRFWDAWQRPARIRLTDRPQSPAVCGLFRPVILLPRSLADHLPPAQLRAVLLHELVHLRRGDVWVNCLQALA
jgi:beta-lactamase regulating signal transducer with metallopeptidase domain